MMLLGMCTVCSDLHYHPSFSSQGFLKGGGGGGEERLGKTRRLSLLTVYTNRSSLAM